jgi:hypothetical protein
MVNRVYYYFGDRNRQKNITQKTRLPDCLDRSGVADFDEISTVVVKSTGQDIDSGRERHENSSDRISGRKFTYQTGKGESND